MQRHLVSARQSITHAIKCELKQIQSLTSVCLESHELDQKSGCLVAAADSCCSKFYYCLSGSAEYRSRHLRATPRPVRGEVNSVSKIDMACRILFPGIFAVFNICYWYFYLYYAAEEDFFE